MELAEIQEAVKDAAEENEIDINDLLLYNISLSIDNYDNAMSNIIDEIDNNIEIDKNNKVIYVTLSLY